MPPSPLTVIVVDDDVDIRRAVGRSLRSYGHRVHLFESGEECLAQNCDGDCAIVDIGLPGAGPHVVAAVERLAREIVDNRMKIRPNCAARTVEADIRPIIEISQRAGIAIEVSCFIGSSPIRQYAEDWDLDRMLRLSENAVSMAVREGLPVMYVTEDTTRAHPDHIRAMYSTAIRAGAKRVCVCDTVGHATPIGVRTRRM